MHGLGEVRYITRGATVLVLHQSPYIAENAETQHHSLGIDAEKDHTFTKRHVRQSACFTSSWIIQIRLHSRRLIHRRDEFDARAVRVKSVSCCSFYEHKVFRRSI